MRDHIQDFMHAWEYWDRAVIRKITYTDWANRLVDAGYAFVLDPSNGSLDVSDWLDDNIGQTNYVRIGEFVWFNDEADAALFMIRWGPQ